MAHTGKLRVAVPDGLQALQVVTTGIEEATGVCIEPELQEIDRGDLVVELRLTDAAVADARLFANTVEHLSEELVVLSSWQEVAAPALATPMASQHVYVGTEAAMPDVARRALRDDLPTAKWPSGAGELKGFWQVAVPFRRKDGEVLVGVQQRRGYSRRFGAQEVKALWWGLAS